MSALENRNVPLANSVVVLDFETTGLSPDIGDRAIEIGAVRLHNGEIIDRFQALMNPGFKISGFIASYTGIDNNMLAKAPPCDEVMDAFANYIGNDNLVAHNASFDKRFLDAELYRIGRSYSGDFTCSLLAARRLFPNAENHKLGTLVKHTKLQSDGAFHRALYDSEMTAKVWMVMLMQLQQAYGLSHVPFSLIQKITKTPKKSVHGLLEKFVAKQ
ncbi:3'-5' exonuclease [Saccharophagus degradans]|uniref:DNA-directed DNA polymerase n=1 Tax=Saccharophagus degradans TaxID=86304 RepID=A0AAW7XAV7_9GAMM|nr:3'-5' exonuclease [Saccharophagus degradans]MDO6424340.1 3'-5' exonuclease [Saccharophagus degradans]MDO6608453.1 3'-5' exonuclease [Saccharophagus degradans]